jgi:hypothetical protein
LPVITEYRWRLNIAAFSAEPHPNVPSPLWGEGQSEGDKNDKIYYCITAAEFDTNGQVLFIAIPIAIAIPILL